MGRLATIRRHSVLLTQEIAYRFVSCNGDSQNDEHCAKREKYHRTAPQARLHQVVLGCVVRACIVSELAAVFATEISADETHADSENHQA